MKPSSPATKARTAKTIAHLSMTWFPFVVMGSAKCGRPGENMSFKNLERHRPARRLVPMRRESSGCRRHRLRQTATPLVMPPLMMVGQAKKRGGQAHDQAAEKNHNDQHHGRVELHPLEVGDRSRIIAGQILIPRPEPQGREAQSDQGARGDDRATERSHCRPPRKVETKDVPDGKMGPID